MAKECIYIYNMQTQQARQDAYVACRWYRVARVSKAPRSLSNLGDQSSRPSWSAAPVTLWLTGCLETQTTPHLEASRSRRAAQAHIL